MEDINRAKTTGIVGGIVIAGAAVGVGAWWLWNKFKGGWGAETDWYLLDEVVLDVPVSTTNLWVLLDEANINLSSSVTNLWVLLDEATININAGSAPSAWVLLDTTYVNITTTVNDMLIGLQTYTPITAYWEIILMDWNVANYLSLTVNDPTEIAGFDIPESWAFPLRWWIILYNASGYVEYEAQSQDPNILDVMYVEQFLYDRWFYRYDIETHQFIRQ